MLAFEYYVNGKKTRTAGIVGPGIVATHVHLLRGVAARKGRKAPEELHLHVGGLSSRTKTHVTWLHRKLRRGDSVRIDVVEVTKVDPPKKNKIESLRSRRKREQDYVAEKATSWGWKIKR